MAADLATQELETRALSWPDRARDITIADQATYSQAADMLIGIKGLRKEIDDSYDPVIRKSHEAHRAAIEAKRKVEMPLAQAETILKRGIATFEQEQERIRQQQEREAREAAARAEEEMRLQTAVQAEELGAEPETVAEILETPLPMVAPEVAPTFQRAAGVSTRETWRGECYSIRDLCKAVAEGKASPELVLPNGPAINQLARAMKQTMNVPGCRAVKETGVAARTR